MGKVHVLAGDRDGHEYNLAIHIPIGAGNNAAAQSWRTCLVNSELGEATVLATGTGPGQISAAELSQVQAGEVYEVTASINIQGVGPSNLGSAVDELVAQISAEKLSELQKALNWFGVVRS